MSTIIEIEQAVKKLSVKDLARFREWFEEYDARTWDKQFERDANSGKLDPLAKQAIADFRKGNKNLEDLILARFFLTSEC